MLSAVLVLLCILLIKITAQMPATSMLPLSVLFVGFIAPRSFAILHGYVDMYSGFAGTPSDFSWLQILLLCVVTTTLLQRAFYLNWMLVPQVSRIAYVASSQISIAELMRQISVSFLFVGVIFCSLYVISLGGVSGLMMNYSASAYNDLSMTQGGVTVVAKNLSIYFIVAGFAMLTASINPEKAIDRKVWVASLVVCTLCATSYIKREYLFEILFVGVVGVYLKGTIRNRTSLLALGACLIFLMIGMFFVRDDELSIAHVAGILDFLDTPEFWMLDQFIQVYQHPGQIVVSDYGLLFLKMFAAPFMDYQSYNSFDRLLIQQTLGIENWGIPGTIYAYLLNSFSPAATILVCAAIGALMGRVDAALGVAASRNTVFVTLVPLWMIFCWFLFRNGDPVIAVFSVNRIVLLVLVVFVFLQVRNKAVVSGAHA